MGGQPSLDTVLGITPAATDPGDITPPPTPPPVVTGEQGASPAPPASGPTPAADQFANERAGLLAALAASRQRARDLELMVSGGGQRYGAPNPPPAAAPPPPAAETMPERRNYASAEEFQVDYMAWLVNQTVTEALQQQQQQDREERRRENLRLTQEQRVSQIQANLDATIVAGTAKYADFDARCEVLRPFLQLSPALYEGLADLGEGAHDVAYHLGSNPAEAARLIQLKNPRIMFRELVRIGARIEVGSAALPTPALGPAAFPGTLTQQRDARGQFAAAAANMTPAWRGPTPLDVVIGTGR